MGTTPFNDDTLAALEKQGGITDNDQEPVGGQDPNDTSGTVLPDDTNPDINVVDVDSSDLGTKEPETTGDTVQATTTDDKTVDNPLAEALTDVGIKYDDVLAQVKQDGEVSADTIAKLKEKYDPDVVDANIRAFKTELELAKFKAAAPKAEPKQSPADPVAKMNDFIYASVGSESNFQAMSKVLEAQASKEEINSINAKLQSGDVTLVKEGIAQAVKTYKDKTGRGGKLMTGDPAANAAQDNTFLSKHEYHNLMKTDKYKTDPMYASKVDNMRMKSRKMDDMTTLPGQYYNQRNGQIYAI